MSEENKLEAPESQGESQDKSQAERKPEPPPNISSSELREYRQGRADGLVGVFSLIALLLLYGAFIWWKSNSPFNPPQRFNVCFHDVASLNYQAAVFVDGVRVGSVDGIKIRGSEDVLVTLRTNPAKIRIPVGSRFIILPNGIVGSKYVEIILPKGAKTDHNLKLLTEQMEVPGDDPIRPEIVVNELVQRLNTIDFDKMQAQLSRSMEKLSNTADHVSSLSTKMEPVAEHANQTVQSMNKLANDMQAPVNQVHQILDQKHPLMKMMFGRPGHIKEENKTETKSDGTVEQKTKTKTKTDAKDSDKSSDTDDKKKKKHHFLGL
ncbi:MAG: MlaD family protein [Candidatus Obscuribacterales bacterium]|nr:MlaD family protein [Candidatus Obscuribacterales bacterium]